MASSKSKFERLSGNGNGAGSDQPVSFSADRYGFSEAGWTALTTEQREVHYNRSRSCEHKYVYGGPADAVDLRESWSFDPYAHTAHMEPCVRPRKLPCSCQVCAGKIGLERGRP